METIQELRQRYELNRKPKEPELLLFEGVNGRDVYNCSVPFEEEGKTYILGRVERRNEWTNSIVLLFEKHPDGKWYRVDSFDALPLEDPFCVRINGETVVGGTHVVKERGTLKTYYTYFYRGRSIFDLRYFTTGPDYMKDIRLVQLPSERVGVFSRPRSEEILRTYGCESQVGFTVLDSLNELDSHTIDSAQYIGGLFAKDEWGGINQALYLGGGLVGGIGHQCYKESCDPEAKMVYLNTAYVFDIRKHSLVQKKVIGQRADYPRAASKAPALADCAFTSGIVVESGRYALYSGLGDTSEGKIVIGDPFAAELPAAL